MSLKVKTVLGGSSVWWWKYCWIVAVFLPFITENGSKDYPETAAEYESSKRKCIRVSGIINPRLTP